MWIWGQRLVLPRTFRLDCSLPHRLHSITNWRRTATHLHPFLHSDQFIAGVLCLAKCHTYRLPKSFSIFSNPCFCFVLFVCCCLFVFVCFCFVLLFFLVQVLAPHESLLLCCSQHMWTKYIWYERNDFYGSVSFWKQFISGFIHSCIGTIPLIHKYNEVFNSFFSIEVDISSLQASRSRNAWVTGAKATQASLSFSFPFLQRKKPCRTLLRHGRQAVLCTCQVQALRQHHGLQYTRNVSCSECCSQCLVTRLLRKGDC